MTKDYHKQMEDLSKVLSGAICESLGLESNMLSDNFDANHTSYLRMNYYPIYDDTESQMAMSRHSKFHIKTNGVTSYQLRIHLLLILVI